MGNPQCEDGYTKIANELQDALVKTRIPGEARQLFDLILRKTYGFNKKSDGISTTQIMVATGMPRRSVERSRACLIAMNLISTVINVGTNWLTYSINKSYNTWVRTVKSDGTVRSVGRVPSKTRTKVPSALVDLYSATKDIKDNIQKTATFIKPSLEEIKEFISKEFLTVDPEQFFFKNESNGWRVGKNPMKCWKSTIRYWERLNKEKRGQTYSTQKHSDGRSRYQVVELLNSTRRYSGL
jgi:phage replication O-like protein O